jgi:hypothetical protein
MRLVDYSKVSSREVADGGANRRLPEQNFESTSSRE